MELFEKLIPTQEFEIFTQFVTSSIIFVNNLGL